MKGVLVVSKTQYAWVNNASGFPEGERISPQIGKILLYFDQPKELPT